MVFFPPHPQGSAHNSGPYTVATAVRVGQIITFALAQGVLLVAAVMTYLALSNDAGQQAQGEPQPEPVIADGGLLGSPDLLMLLIGLSIAAICCFAAVLIPSLIRQRAIDRFHASNESLPMPLQAHDDLPPAARDLVQSRMTATLTSQALLEGAGMINAIFLLISPHLLYLVPIVIAVFGIVVQVPTVAKLLDWLDTIRRS